MGYIIEEKSSFQVIGRRCVTKEGGGAWDVSRRDGSLGKLEQLATEKPFLLVCFGWTEDGSNDNMVGIEYNKKPTIDLDSYCFPESLWLAVDVKGKISENVLGRSWNTIHETILPEEGCVKASLPTIENYIDWNEDSDFCQIEIRIPIERK